MPAGSIDQLLFVPYGLTPITLPALSVMSLAFIGRNRTHAVARSFDPPPAFVPRAPMAARLKCGTSARTGICSTRISTTVAMRFAAARVWPRLNQKWHGADVQWGRLAINDRDRQGRLGASGFARSSWFALQIVEPGCVGDDSGSKAAAQAPDLRFDRAVRRGRVSIRPNRDVCKLSFKALMSPMVRLSGGAVCHRPCLKDRILDAPGRLCCSRFPRHDDGGLLL
jgi:hypothetical protein